jgi:hypothetical protein
MYRRSLAASWAAGALEIPGEPTPEEVIEDIFNGGDGWPGVWPGSRGGPSRSASARERERERHPPGAAEEDSGSISGDEGVGGTLRPSDLRRMHLSQSSSTHVPIHRRQQSNASDRSVTTVTGREGRSNEAGGGGTPRPGAGASAHRRSGSHRNVGASGPKDDFEGGTRPRSESLTSLAPTMGSSERGREHGWKRATEVSEEEMREDLVAWRLPGNGA